MNYKHKYIKYKYKYLQSGGNDQRIWIIRHSERLDFVDRNAWKKHPRYKKDDLREACTNDYIMTGKEAVKLGLADKVLS